jgi:hypothetical protein
MSDVATPEGRVGIFWLYRGEIIADCVPWPEGDEYGEFMNGLSDHCTYWSAVQRRVPALRSYEYEQVPRGRVIYNTGNKSFTVLGNKRLLRDEDQQTLVLKEFQLSRKNSRFLFDEHYGPVPGMLEG